MERLTQWTPQGASLILGDPKNEFEARVILKEQFKKACNLLAELEDKLESGRLVELPCNPLTIEELNALPLGDWVWFVNLIDHEESCYKQINDICEEESWVWFEEDVHASHFVDYGTEWLAYKNKEQAEARLKELERRGMDKEKEIDTEDTACVALICIGDDGKKYVEHEDWQKDIRRLQLIIKKLKEEKKEIQDQFEIAHLTKNRLTIFDRNELYEKARKETAKEIFDELGSWYGEKLDKEDVLEFLSEEYGVEVDDV